MTQQDQTNHVQTQRGRVAIYARPASRAQTQTTQQAAALIALANELGYPNEQIVVYEDVGVSARKPLARSGALSDLLAAITQDTEGPEQERIHSVFVSSPCRLFRDPASVDIATFLHTCAQHNVQIVTPDMTFDLTDPARTSQTRSSASTLESAGKDRQANKADTIAETERECMACLRRGFYAIIGVGYPQTLVSAAVRVANSHHASLRYIHHARRPHTRTSYLFLCGNTPTRHHPLTHFRRSCVAAARQGQLVRSTSDHRPGVTENTA